MTAICEQFDAVVAGRLVLPDGSLPHGQVVVKDGRIAAILGADVRVRAKVALGSERCFVLPGAIDGHVHARSTSHEGVNNLTRSAAAGGVTTVVDMPYDSPCGVTTEEQFAAKIDLVNHEAVVDVALYGTIKKAGGIDEIEPMIKLGACGFKLSTFETDPERFPRIPAYQLMEALPVIGKHGLVASFHAEHEEIINELVRRYREQGRTYPRAHAETRPPITETLAILEVLEIAYWTGCPVHIVHCTVPRGFDLVQRFRADGMKATAETCIHYLVLTEDDLDGMGGIAKCNPALRSREYVDQLWAYLRDGRIDMVTSDHAPWPIQSKVNANIFENSSGLPGVETLVPLLWSEGVAKRRISPHRLAEVLSTNPARIFHLDYRKGALRVGMDADITVIDPDIEWTFSAVKAQTSAKWSPFNGWRLRGKVVATVVRGQLIFDGEEVRANAGVGTFIPAHLDP